MPMPTFPALPSDNLYKFGAFCGLVMLVVGVFAEPYLKRLWIEDTNKRWDTTEARRDSMEVQSADLLIKAEQITDKERKATVISGIEGERERVRKMEAYGWNKEFDARSEQFWKHIALAKWLGIGGLGLLVVCLALWWKRVQRHQDNALSAKAAKVMAEAKDAEKIKEEAILRVSATLKECIRDAILERHSQQPTPTLPGPSSEQG
jgi:hypothetical protein